MSIAWQIRAANIECHSPRGWRVRRIVDLVDLANGYPFPSDSFGSTGEIPLVRIRELVTHVEDFSTYVSGDIPRECILENGDIVVGMDGDFNAIRWARGKAALNQRLCRLRPRAGVDIRFIGYALPSILGIINDLTYSTTVKHLSSSDILSEILPLPPLDEQRRIADFLDAETARIDELIRLRKIQVDRLAEALRNEAGRINPDWQRVPLRRVVNSAQTGTTPSEILLPADPENVPWYTPAALGGTLDLNEADKSIRREDFPAVPRFPAGSILIVGIGESLGKVADLDHEATGNQQLTAINIPSASDRRFVLWRLYAAYDEIRNWAQYSRIRILNNDVLKSFRIPVPELGEQIKIRQKLDHRLAEFIGFRDAAAQFSRLASERRQALITAAVTGAITV